MPVTSAIGIRSDPSISRAFAAGLAAAEAQRQQQGAILREYLRQLMEREEAAYKERLKQEAEERQGQELAGFLGRYFQANPEVARQLGYAQSVLPEAGAPAEYEPERVQIEPVSPRAASKVFDFLLQGIQKPQAAEERALRIVERKGEVQKGLLEERGAQQQELERLRQQGREELEALRQRGRTELEGRRERLKRWETEFRTGQQSAAKLAELRKQEFDLRSRLAEAERDARALRMRMADPSLSAADRARYGALAEMAESEAADYRRLAEEAARLRGEAERGLFLGPERRPPTERPGPPQEKPTIRMRYDPKTGRLVPK